MYDSCGPYLNVTLSANTSKIGVSSSTILILCSITDPSSLKNDTFIVSAMSLSIVDTGSSG